MTDQLFQFSLNDVIGEFQEYHSVDLRKIITKGTLEDGREFQLHIIVTTDEDDFIASTNSKPIKRK